jgi:hypothetical protein
MTGVSNEWVSINSLVQNGASIGTGGNTNAYVTIPLSAGVGVFGAQGAGTVLYSVQALNAGQFVSLSSNYSSGSCATPPVFNVFDGTSNTGVSLTPSVSAAQTKGNQSVSYQTLAFNAGDIIGIYVQTAGSSCSGAVFSLAAIAKEAP